jgi:predicted nuclease of restriction endonuclease-like (RecB) superfamily
MTGRPESPAAKEFRLSGRAGRGTIPLAGLFSAREGEEMARRKPKAETSLVKARPPGSLDYGALVEAIAQAHVTAQGRAAQAVNVLLTLRNWLIGCHIVEYEQNGRDRAEYGERLLDELARDLRRKLGRGFGKRYLEMFRQFYLRYPIAKTLFSQFGIEPPYQPSAPVPALDWQDDKYFGRLFSGLSWGHLIGLMRMDDPLRRAFYEVESLKNKWSLRELRRQIASLLFERVGLSRDKEGVLELAKQGEIVTTPVEMVRDPYVFEFLGLKREELYAESQVERALLDHLQDFLMEMGKGFCFVARQRRVTFDNDHFWIDLLLYNRRLKCLVAIDLILGPFRHEYAGAMNFYLNYLRAEEREADEAAPVGIILCLEKNETHVEYALGGISNQIFVSRYLENIPTREELEAFLRRSQRRLPDVDLSSPPQAPGPMTGRPEAPA